MIIEVDNIELNFSNKRILNAIYLKAESGKVTGILGSNGCGKSCLLQIMFGSLTPKYKLVRINNKPITKPLYRTNLVAILPQHNFTPNGVKLKTLFSILNVDWNTFTATFHGFSNHRNLAVNKLSGGERRLVETYLILKGNHKIILLDEPFSHIAPLHIETIKSLIEEEKKHKAIVITDHMYQHIIEASDAVYLLKEGYTKRITDFKDLEFFNYLSVGTLD